MKLKYILVLPVLFVIAAGVAQTSFATPSCPTVGATVCSSTQILVNGSCFNVTNLVSDVNNCGAIGHVCSSGQQCFNGVCAVPPTAPVMVCSGTCVDPSRSGNCGICGAVCGANASCLASGSSYACGCTTTGQTYCGATIGCAALTTDVNNCGKCSNKCVPASTCSGGVCSCAAGTVNCGTTIGCANVSTDPKNCGGCGKACASGKTCAAGVCSP